MDFNMYLFGALLTLLALLILVVPIIRYRKDKGVSITLSILIVVFPVAVAFVYTSISSYDWQAQKMSVAEQESLPPVEEMVAELEARQNETPTLEGWIMLGRSYIAIEQFEQAADAYYEAWVLTEGQDVEIEISYAEALILSDKRTLVTSAADLLESAILKAPNDPRVLWYGGLSAAALGNNEVAVARLSRLLQADLPEGMRNVVQQQLASLGAEVPDDAAITDGTSIEVSIALGPGVVPQVTGSSRMFLIARDLDNPRPPVAVKRVRVGEFPITLRISDSDVMVPGKRLSDVARLQLVARISLSGNAMASDGDLYGEAEPGTTEDGNLTGTISIDRVVGQD